MRKDSTKIFVVSVLLTTALIGGAWYKTKDWTRPEQSGTPTKQSLHSISPSQASGDAIVLPNVPAETSTKRTNTPIKCTDPEIGVFYTNAATCEGADLNNRLSYSAPLAKASKRLEYDNKDYRAPREEAETSRANEKSDQ